MKYLLIILLSLFSLYGIAQLPTGFPTQMNTGWQQWGYQQSTLGTIIANRDTNWTPRYCFTIVGWPHAGVDTAYWMWDCVKWKKISTASDIRQQSVGWCNIVNAGADSTGVIDASPYVQALIDGGCKVIYAPEGTYLLNSTIQMKDSVMIVGDGRATVFKITKNIPGFKCGWALGGTKSTFQDISFVGTFTDSTLQDGIFADSSNGILVSNVAASRLAGAAIRMRRTGFCCGMYTMNAVRGNIISDCYFDSCQVGVKVDTVAEFITIANTTATNGGIGIFTAAGSTNISSCRLGMNEYGIYMTGGSNNSHGTCENTHMPHNKQYGVYITGATNGYRFVGNMIRQSVTAEVFIENSTNINFEHNDIGTGAIIVNTSTATKFLDNLYWGPPVWTVTGTAPTVIQNGETINTISIKDVVNSKQLDITHDNGVVDFTVAPGGKYRFDDTVFTRYIASGTTNNDTLHIMSSTNVTPTQSGIQFFVDHPTNGVKAGYWDARTGYLGIGTRSVSAALHVRNSRPGANAEFRLSEDTTCGSCGSRILLQNNGDVTNGQIFVGGTTNAFMPRGMMIHTTGVDGLKFATNGASGQDIEFAGSVLPGTSSWGRFKGGTGNFVVGTFADNTVGKVQVEGRLTVSTHTVAADSDSAVVWNRTTNAYELAKINGGGGGGMAIGGAITSATEGSVLFAGVGGVLEQDNSNFFYNNTTNDLGLGTPTPQAPLHVYDASDARIALSNTTGSDNGLAIAFTAPNVYFYNRASGFIDIATNNTSRMKISAAGVVNIVDLAGSGTRMVVAGATGDLSTQTIPGNGIYGGSGSLPSDVTVSTAGFTTTWTGTNDNETSFSVVNAGTTNASAISGSATGTTSVGVSGTSSQYIGVTGTSTSNNGIQGSSVSGTGIVGVSTTGVAFSGQINPTTTNTIANVLTLRATTSSGASANGFGAATQYELETATSGTSQIAGAVSFEWTDATNATRTSRFRIKGVNSASDATLATFDGNGNVTFGTTNSVVGTATNNDAVAGNVGEEFNSTVSTYTNYTTTATYQNIASITLTAGDWDLSAFFTYSSNSATITAASNAIFVVSTTTASAAGATEGKDIAYLPQAALLGTSLFSDAIAPYRVSISGTTTYYLNTQATFTLGNPQYVGGLRARRVR